MPLQQPHLSHPKYRPDIDGLRAVAVLAVVVFHAFPDWLRGGFIGVDIFFVISGYLISTIIFENLDKGTFNFYEFYTRRIKRIFPALLTVLIFCFTVGWFFLLSDEYKQLGKHIAAGAIFISNFVLWSESGYFDKSAETKPLLHLWSLGIEEQFYIVWPFLLWFAWKQKFNLFKITIVVACASFILNITEIKQDTVATFYSPLSRFWELLSGSLLAWLTLYKKITFTSVRNKIDIDNVLSFIGLFLLIFGFWKINKDLSFPGKWALVPVLGAVLIITAGSKAWFNRTVLSNKIVVWFGLISFPLYLWHWPLLSFATIIEGETPSYNIRITAVGLSVTLAWLTYRFIECPLRFGINTKAAALIFLMAIVGCVGFYTYDRDGFSFRKADTYNINRMTWYQGKEDWLFLGGAYNKTVAKLKLSITPTKREIENMRETFSRIAQAGAESNTKVVLIVGTNKSNVYPEFLPDNVVPSTQKYSGFFLDELKEIPNLTVYNPMDDLLRLKKTEGILYWMTDTHWNNKGAFLVYSGFSNLFGLPVPQVEFKQGSVHSGDLIGISGLKNFPLHKEDNWDVIWKNKPAITEKEIPNEQKTTFGPTTIAHNNNPLSNKYIWVVGDSFTGALKQYFSATFKEVHYIGHWDKKLRELPADLAKSDRKPDMIIIVRVERSF